MYVNKINKQGSLDTWRMFWRNLEFSIGVNEDFFNASLDEFKTRTQNQQKIIIRTILAAGLLEGKLTYPLEIFTHDSWIRNYYLDCIEFCKFANCEINHATETPTGNSADNLTFVSARDKGHFILVGDKYK